jgi:hypothetical protein
MRFKYIIIAIFLPTIAQIGFANQDPYISSESRYREQIQALQQQIDKLETAPSIKSSLSSGGTTLSANSVQSARDPRTTGRTLKQLQYSYGVSSKMHRGSLISINRQIEKLSDEPGSEAKIKEYKAALDQGLEVYIKDGVEHFSSRDREPSVQTWLIRASDYDQLPKMFPQEFVDEYFSEVTAQYVATQKADINEFPELKNSLIEAAQSLEQRGNLHRHLSLISEDTSELDVIIKKQIDSINLARQPKKEPEKAPSAGNQKVVETNTRLAPRMSWDEAMADDSPTYSPLEKELENPDGKIVVPDTYGVPSPLEIRLALLRAFAKNTGMIKNSYITTYGIPISGVNEMTKQIQDPKLRRLEALLQRYQKETTADKFFIYITQTNPILAAEHPEGGYAIKYDFAMTLKDSKLIEELSKSEKASVQAAFYGNLMKKARSEMEAGNVIIDRFVLTEDGWQSPTALERSYDRQLKFWQIMDNFAAGLQRGLYDAIVFKDYFIYYNP